MVGVPPVGGGVWERCVAMENVRLLTAGGGFVASGVVPKFDEPPGVLIWGERFFTYDNTDDESVHVYVETFTFVLTDVR